MQLIIMQYLIKINDSELIVTKSKLLTYKLIQKIWFFGTLSFYDLVYLGG